MRLRCIEEDIKCVVVIPLYLTLVSVELATVRADFDRPEVDDTYFHVRILGGSWTKTNIGVTADAAKGLARCQLAKMFCNKFNFPKEQTFTFSKFGEVASSLMAHEYARIGNFFCDLWIEQSVEGQAFFFTDQMLDSIPADEDYVDWLLAQPITHVNWDRGTQVRLLKPDQHEVV